MYPILKPKIALVLSLWLAFSAQADLILPNSSPNPGPRSPEEANVLYQQAQTALSGGHADSAIRDLIRFRNRYPTVSRFVQAGIQLSQANFDAHHFDESARIAKEVLHSRLTPEETLKTKFLLAEAYLKLKHYSEAKITADEILKNGGDAIP